MKKILLLVLLVLFCSGSVFGGEFEDTLKKAEQGDAAAQYDIGIMYKTGIGVPQNYKRAYIWFSLAAAQGHKDAVKKRNLTEKKLSPQQLGEAQEIAFEKNSKKGEDKKVKNQSETQNSDKGYVKKVYEQIDLYKMILGAAIEQNWVFNDALARMDQNLEVRILIKILKSGVIRDIIYETRSGNRYLDESAREAIKKANPLPRLPAGMDSYDVVVSFTPKGLH